MHQGRARPGHVRLVDYDEFDKIPGHVWLDDEGGLDEFDNIPALACQQRDAGATLNSSPSPGVLDSPDMDAMEAHRPSGILELTPEISEEDNIDDPSQCALIRSYECLPNECLPCRAPAAIC